MTPLPGLKPGSDVMLVGGTFDPPHLAHIRLSCQAREVVAPKALLYFVPAARSPLKDGGPEASGQARTEMLRLALKGIEQGDVWTDELDRAEAGEPSYWVVTLRRARELIGRAQRLYFLIGADQALSFERWKSPDEILELAQVVVINRGGVRTKQELAERLEGSALGDRLVDAWCEVEHLDISATDVRLFLSESRENRIQFMLHPDVLNYIKARSLYIE